MKKSYPILIICLLFGIFSFAVNGKNSPIIVNKSSERAKEINDENLKIVSDLLADFKTEYTVKKDMEMLSDKALKVGKESVPALIQVMKRSDYPDKNRWLATFLLGKIVGKKAIPFIGKFLEHPNWVLRMASLKTLQSLQDKSHKKQYEELLKDKSMIVRIQAIEILNKLQIKESAKEIWKMIFREQNYQVTKGKKKRLPIIKDVIRAIGDLKYEEARASLLTMLKNKRYDDLFSELDYSLEKITGKKSPKGKVVEKRIFWEKYALKEKVIL